jgi:hypothetical protein
MKLVAQHVAHDTDYCKFEIEEYRTDEGHPMLLAHLHVKQWSPSALKKIRHDWKVFRQHITAPLFATPMVDDDKWRKFVTLMGWRPTGQMVLCRDGIERPIYIHTV